MTKVESAWASHPGYWINLVPIQGTARVLVDGVLLAESTKAIRLIEKDHVERLYIPEGDVRLDLLATNEHHTVCPFKGNADYWSFDETATPVEDVFWTYRDPFEQVAGIQGFLGVYHEKDGVEAEIISTWPEDELTYTTPFPAWGDEDDLLGLMDPQLVSEGVYAAPGYHVRTRNVVEGGQLLGQAIVAASKANPDQRVVSASATFAKAANFDDPIDLNVELVRKGRNFSSVTVRSEQRGALISPSLLLMDVGAEDLMRNETPMPDVPGPEACPSFDMSVIGRDIRVVDGAYPGDIDEVGPANVYVWMRFRDNPPTQALRSAALTQAVPHWTIAAAMRPHPGISQSQAHVTLSTGIMALDMSFHDDAPLDEWFLYANPVAWSGRGLTIGTGTIFSHTGLMLASYVVHGMARSITARPDAIGKDPSDFM